MAVRPWPAGAPAPPLPSRRPSLLVAIALQTLLLREPIRRRIHRAELDAAPSGGGRTVLVLPGMGVGDLSTFRLRRFLRRHGFDARGWGLGRHHPDVPATLERLSPRLDELVEASGRPLDLVGWSLGGVVARELARLRPDRIARVVTLGTPVVGGLLHTAIAGFYRIQGWDIETIAERVGQANRIPIRVPVTAIWSRRDGIVAWQACVDLATPEVENLEVGSVHWGLGLDPDVLVAVAERLARPRPAPGPNGDSPATPV